MAEVLSPTKAGELTYTAPINMLTTKYSSVNGFGVV